MSTVLQMHPRVQHWTHWIQSNKNTESILELITVHAQRSFPKNHDYHLRVEPIAPYDTTPWSSTYDRGQALSLIDLQEYYIQNSDHYLEEGIRNNLYINLIFNKINLPKFCAGAPVITLVIDSKRSLDWVQRTLWKKHFIELDDKIIYCPNHPVYCPDPSVKTVVRHKNKCEFDKNQKSRLIEQYIYQNPTFKQFMTDELFEDANHSSIPISALFAKDQLILHLNNVASKLNWCDFDSEIITAIHQSWLDSQLAF